MPEQERGTNVLSRIDEEQRALRARLAQQIELAQRVEVPKKPHKSKPKRTLATNVQFTAAPAKSVKNEGLRSRFPGTAAFIDELRNPKIRAQLDVVFTEKEVNLAMQAMAGHTQHGSVEEYRAEFTRTIFSALVFQLVKASEGESNVVLRPSEVKDMLLGQSSVPDGLLLVPSKDGKSTDITVVYQYINSRHTVPLKKIDTMTGLMRATSGSIGSARVSGYLRERYPHLPPIVTVGRQYFSLRYILPADLEAPLGISEKEIDRISLGTRDLGILTTRVIGDLSKYPL